MNRAIPTMIVAALLAGPALWAALDDAPAPAPHANVPGDATAPPPAAPARPVVPVPSIPRLATTPSASQPVNASEDPTRNQNEPSVAVNPTDPLNVVIGANDWRTGTVRLAAYVSQDGGATWTQTLLPQPSGGYAYGGDPAVAFASDGTLHFVGMAFNEDDGPNTSNALVAHKSVDGGVTWTGPTLIVSSPDDSPFYDRPALAVDPANGDVHVVFSEFTARPGGAVSVKAVKSVDDGATWSAPVSVGGGYIAGVAVGPGHVVYVVHSTGAGFQVRRSTDGGATFPLRSSFPAPSLQMRGYPAFNNYAAIAVDATGGAHDGTLYLALPDTPALPLPGSATRMTLRGSTDGGLTWPLQTASLPPNDLDQQFMPWVAVDGLGRVGVVTYEYANPLLQATFVLATYDPSGALTSTTFPLSDTYVPLSGFNGDYLGVAAGPAAFHPAWTAPQPSYDREVFTSKVT